MAEFTTVDQKAFNAAIIRGTRTIEQPHARTVRFDRSTSLLLVSLAMGQCFAIDPRRLPGLAHVGLDDLSDVSIEGIGTALRFPRLDADFSVARIVDDFVEDADWVEAAE